MVLSTRPVFDPAQYLKKEEVAAPAAPALEEKPSLAERLGGEAALVAAVDLFYSKITVDPELKRFFEKIPLTLLKQKQVRMAARM